MSDYKVLVVDDEANVLESYRRQYKKLCRVDTALSGADGVDAVLSRGEYAVVISDYRMPEMDGVEFLSFVRQMSPDTVRILHTGYADLETAIDAVNEGAIFRLLTKPCPPSAMKRALSEAFQQYDLVKSERVLLDNTLKGSLKVLSDVLSLVKPDVYGRIGRISPVVQRLSKKLDDPDAWRTSSAAFLAFLGFISLPDELIAKVDAGKSLSPEEQEVFDKHPSVAADLIKRIPRMEDVAKIVAYQEKRFDGHGPPDDAVCGEDIPLGARILKAAIDFDSLLWSGGSVQEALETMKGRQGVYDPRILEELESVLTESVASMERLVFVRDMEEGMVLLDDVLTLSDGRKVLSRGQVMTPTLLQALRRCASMFGVSEPIKVVERFV